MITASNLTFTYLEHLKGLLKPSYGTINVDGFNTDDEISRFEIMKRVGLVFQNPDNTIVATTVERELAFGLENTGVPYPEMHERVDETLQRFDLEQYRHTNPAHLSGGEKQRLSLASVMIMRPTHLILDEPTSLLDPWSRDHILSLINEMAHEGATIIHITQFVHEARKAERILVLDNSGIILDGAPEEVISESRRFRLRGFKYLKSEEHVFLCEPDSAEKMRNAQKRDTVTSSEKSVAIALEHISHKYEKGTPFEKAALDDISLELRKGSSTALLGPTGGGKTTLLEIADGLITPTDGSLHVQRNLIRAMAFQSPEDQMVSDSVSSYVAFGPENIGVAKNDIGEVVSRALEEVGLDPEHYTNRDPLSLSGGEKRRAALAGVFAMSPDMLLLDEPTAGLDCEGTEMILRLLMRYVKGGGTLIFSTHDFEAALCSAEYAVVLEEGKIEASGEVRNVFMESKWLTSLEDRV